MRRPLLFALGFTLLGACGDDDAASPVPCPEPAPFVEAGPPPEIDAGPLMRDPVSRDAAPPPQRQTTLSLLRASSTARFIGVTTGPAPHAAYLVANTHDTFDLEVVPVTGGTPSVLATDIDLFEGDGVVLRGGALAWYVGVDADAQSPEIHLWSAASGIKTVTTPTQVGLFWATEDGARVAFSANAAAATTDIAVTTLADPTAATPALTGANAMNLAVSELDCPSRLDFRGANFIAAYCTGVETTATQPTLVTVGADGAAVVRLDSSAPANDFDGTWVSDAAGTKIVVNDVTAGVHLVDASSPVTTITGVLAKAETAGVTPDGTQALVLAGGALKKVTFADPPLVTDLVPSGVAQLFTITKDSKTLLFAKENVGGLTDLHALDLSVPAPTPVALRETPTHLFVGLTGTGSHAFVIDAVQSNAQKVFSVPLAGGAPVLLVDPIHRASGGLDVEPSPTGTGLVFTIDSAAVTGTAIERSTLGYVDALKGGGLEPAATILRARDERGDWAGKTYVFRDVGTKPGIYALTLP